MVMSLAQHVLTVSRVATLTPSLVCCQRYANDVAEMLKLRIVMRRRRTGVCVCVLLPLNEPKLGVIPIPSPQCVEVAVCPSPRLCITLRTRRIELSSLTPRTRLTPVYALLCFVPAAGSHSSTWRIKCVLVTLPETLLTPHAAVAVYVAPTGCPHSSGQLREADAHHPETAHAARH